MRYYFNLFIFNILFILKVNSCLFILAGYKSKFLHSVGSACIYQDNMLKMSQYDSFADTVDTMGFYEGNYHVELNVSDLRIDFSNTTYKINTIPSFICEGKSYEVGYECFDLKSSLYCQTLCDKAYEKCILWFNTKVQ